MAVFFVTAPASAKASSSLSQKLVGLLLRELGYSCQANRKTREGASHPDRDAQFEHINKTVKAALATAAPAISVDTKKKELIGDFKNGGKELRPKGQPEPVRVHPRPGRPGPYDAGQRRSVNRRAGAEAQDRAEPSDLRQRRSFERFDGGRVVR
jgi:hypothetical protein